MRSFLTIFLTALCGYAAAFAPTSSFAHNSVSVENGQPLVSMNAAEERTYVMIKPDGVQRGLVGNIISRFEAKGYKLAAIKTMQATGDMLDQHYKDLVDEPFFPKMKEYMLSGPVVCMVWVGKEAKAIVTFATGVTQLRAQIEKLHFGSKMEKF